MKRYWRNQKGQHTIFIVLERHDTVLREVMWRALEKKESKIADMRAIKDSYKGAASSV